MFRIALFLGAFAMGLANLVLVDDVRVQATNVWNFINKIDGYEMQGNYRENIEDHNVGDINCLRYCIERGVSAEKRMEDVRIKWNLEGKLDLGSSSRVEQIFEPEIETRSRSKYVMSSEYPCTFSLMMGCVFPHKTYEKYNNDELDFLENITPALGLINTSAHKIKLERKNLFGVYKINFEVEPHDQIFDVFIRGNISTIELQMPIVQPSFGSAAADAHRATTNALQQQREPQVTLTSRRMPSSHQANSLYALRLSVRNPQQGDYGLKITGVDRTSYDMTVTTRNDWHGDDSQQEGADLHFTKNYWRDGDHVSSIKPRFAPTTTYDRNDDVDKKSLLYLDSFDYQHKTPIRFPDDNPSKVPEISEERIKDKDDNVTFRLSSSSIEERFWGGPVDSIPQTDLYETPIRKPLVVEVFEGAQLIIPAPYGPMGNHHQIPFRITNNYIVPFHIIIEASCRECLVTGIRTPNDMPLILPGFPLKLDIPPGETYLVIVSIELPPIATEVFYATLSLIVTGISTVKKDVKIMVRDRELPPRYKPTIKPYFNNNCPRTYNKCHETYWSADIYIQDSDTGLMTAESSPRGMYAEKPYESGTQQEVKFYYSNNCCNKIAKILAVDSMGVSSIYIVDVDVWYNLTKMEWVAVALGILLVIAILIIILILVMKNRRDTIDLSYSQRYGSRSGPRTPTD